MDEFQEQGGSPASGEDPSAGDSLLDDVILDIGDYKGMSGGPRSMSVPMDENEVDQEDPGTESPAKDPEKPEEKNPSKSEAEGEDEKGAVKHMRKVIDSLQKEVRKLKESKEAPPEKDEERLSDEQLMQIMKEHEGDPEVMLNIMKYLQKQGIKDSEKAVATAAKVGDITKQADSYLSSVFNGYGSEEFNTELDEAFPLDDWGLRGNPMARQIQAGIALASTYKTVLNRELAKAIAAEKQTKTKVEEKRQESISKRTMPKAGEKAPNAKLEGRTAQVAKELGLSDKQAQLYASFMSKKGR